MTDVGPMFLVFSVLDFLWVTGDPLVDKGSKNFFGFD